VNINALGLEGLLNHIRQIFTRSLLFLSIVIRMLEKRERKTNFFTSLIRKQKTFKVPVKNKSKEVFSNTNKSPSPLLLKLN